MSNLIVIFIHYPIKADESDKKKLTKLAKEINEILNNLFDIKSYMKIPEIPAYFLDTKIYKQNGNSFVDNNSYLACKDLIEELKYKLKSSFYSLINTFNLICNKEEVKKKTDKEFKQLKKEMENFEKLKNKNSSSKNPSKELMEIKIKIRKKNKTSQNRRGRI